MVKEADITVTFPWDVKHARKRPFGATAILMIGAWTRSRSPWSSLPFLSTTRTVLSRVPSRTSTLPEVVNCGRSG